MKKKRKRGARKKTRENKIKRIEEITGIGIFLLAIIFSLIFDKEISSIFTNFLLFPIILMVFMIISIIGSFYITILLSTAFFVTKKKIKKLWRIWGAFLITIISSLIIKILIKRPRPYQTLSLAIPDKLIALSHITWNFGFPSLHAGIAFATLPFFQKYYPKFTWIWIVYVCIISISRVVLGLHYLGDVLVGALIGYLAGFIFIRIKIKREEIKVKR